MRISDATKLTAPLRRAVANMVSRAVVKLVNDAAGMQVVQLGLLAGETRDQAERFQQYGFTSVPLEGAEAVVVFVGGTRDHPLVVCVDDRRYRPKGMQDGEAQMYNHIGDYIHIKADGSIKVVAAMKVDITAPLVEITAPLVTMSGDLEVAGDISDKDGMLKSIRDTYNNHTHDETTTVTLTPNQTMPST